MQLKLTATKRDSLGKKLTRVRAEGKLPAVVYGHHAESTPLMLDGHEFQRVFARAGRSHLVDLVVDGSAPEKVLVREIQTHPRRVGPIHVDLYQVSMQEKLRADIPVRLTGESPVVKQGEGDLLHAMHQLEVECLPGDIPESFVVDVSGLTEIDADVRVKDIPAPPGVEILADPEDLIVKVVARRELAVEEAAPEEAEAEGEEAAEAEGEAEAEGAEEA
jgi:large subunit ribosomal protein L25